MRGMILAMTLLALLPGASLPANEKILVAAFEYPPIYIDGKRKGLSGDIVVAAFKAVNIDVDMQFYPVARMVSVVSEGDALCGIGGTILFSEPDVASNVSVSSAIQYVSQTFLYDVRGYPDGIAFDSLSDMAGYRIGVLSGSGIMKLLQGEPGLNLVTNNIHEGSARQLYVGRVDIWAIVDLTGMMYMKDLYPREADNYRYTRAYNLGDVSLVFSKKKDPWGVYEAAFRKGFAIIKKDGTYMRIMAGYYGGEHRINPEALVADMR